MHMLTRTFSRTQDIETTMLSVLRSIAKPFALGEREAVGAGNTTAAMYRTQLLGARIPLIVNASGHSASAVLPASLASSLSLDSNTVVDAVMHVSSNAPLMMDTGGDSLLVTPLVGVTLTKQGTSEELKVSGLPESDPVVITLPITQDIPPFYNGIMWRKDLACMYFNGTGYSSEGCTTTPALSQGVVHCSCSHLTQFVVKVSMKDSCSWSTGFTKICIRKCIFAFLFPAWLLACRTVCASVCP
jgi:hypothetical protein